VSDEMLNVAADHRFLERLAAAAAAAGAGARHARHRRRHARQDQDRPPRLQVRVRGSGRAGRARPRGSLLHVQPAGLHVHLGSQINQLGTYASAVDWLVAFIEEHGLGELPVLDLGGGLGIAHAPGDIELAIQPSLEAICAHLTDALIAHGLPMPELVVEPGRSIAGPAGTTLYRVGSIKRRPTAPCTRRWTAACPTTRGRRCTAPATRRSSATGRTS
jgi:Diaminopimelate decarboxylase